MSLGKGKRQKVLIYQMVVEDFGTELKSSSQSKANQRQPTVFIFFLLEKSQLYFSELKHI
jgi:hypothetical protein